MKVFINQFEDKFEWHNWFKDMMDEQNIKYNFKERGDDDSDIEDKKEKADFIVYIFTEDTEPVVEHATNALLDSKNHSEKVIYRILEDGKNIDKSVLETLKKIEAEVEDNGSKIVNAPAHAINYIKYVEKEGEEYKGDNPNEDESEEDELHKESTGFNGGDNVNKISNSNVFKYLDNVLNLQSKIDVFLNNAREVDEYNCEIGFKLFERENPPYKNMVMDMMRKGKIKLLYNEDSSLSRSLMFIPMFKNQDDFVLYINVTSLAKEKEVVEGGEKSYEYEFINNKSLSNVLISGYALLKTAQKPNLVSYNQKVKKSVFNLYSEMMLGTINRIGSLSNDKDNAKIVKYILAKFFYLGMLGREYNDKIEESCVNLAEAKGIEKVEVIKMKHENEEFKNISSVLELITAEFPQLEIDLSSLVKVHTMLYGEGTLLTIDYVPYIVALAFAERFRFAIYTSSKNLRKNFKLPANDIQVSLMDKLK